MSINTEVDAGTAAAALCRHPESPKLVTYLQRSRITVLQEPGHQRVLFRRERTIGQLRFLNWHSVNLAA
jgi:hypothetical protein